MIKLIWDFRGMHAKGIAEHHKIHLDEFGIRENLENFKAETEGITEMYWTATLIVEESKAEIVEKALRPNRIEALN